MKVFDFVLVVDDTDKCCCPTVRGVTSENAQVVLEGIYKGCILSLNLYGLSHACFAANLLVCMWNRSVKGDVMFAW